MPEGEGREEEMVHAENYFVSSETCRWNPRRAIPSTSALILAVLSFLGFLGVVKAQSAPSNENDVKAAYLYNFARSARWLDNEPGTESAPFVIGIAGGEADFVKRLAAMTDGRTVESHPVVTKAVTTESEMRSCRLVFFDNSESGHQSAIIANLLSAQVLMVGEEASFLRQGGMINLYPQSNKIHFEVNQQSLDRARIRLTSELLQLAKPAGSSPKTAKAERHLRFSPQVPYPELARRLNIKGVVNLQAVVRRDGTIKDVKVLGGNPVLAEATSQAIRDWKYDPASGETLEHLEYSFAP